MTDKQQSNSLMSTPSSASTSHGADQVAVPPSRSTGDGIFQALTAQRDDPAAMIETTIKHFRRTGQPLELFEALKFRIRNRLGLPLITPENEPRQSDEVDRQLEAGLLDACRETGRMLLSQGRVREGWMYLRPTGDLAEAARLLGQIEVTDDNADDLIGVLLYEGVDIDRGFRLLLARNGTCNSITTYDQAIASRDKASRAAAAHALLDHFYDELCECVRADIASREAPAGDHETLGQMLEKRSWILREGGYHLDTTHLSSVIRIARVLDDDASLQRAWELTQYGKRLHHQFQYPGEEPFVDFYPAHAAYYSILLGRDVDAGLAIFERKMLAADPAEHGTVPLEVYADLLFRVGRGTAAIEVVIAQVPDDVPAARLVPMLLDMARQCGHFQPILDYCVRQADPLGYAATAAAARNHASRCS